MKELLVHVDRNLEAGLCGIATPAPRQRLVEAGRIIKDDATGEVLIVFGKLPKFAVGNIKRELPDLPYTENDRLTRRKNNFANVKARDVQFGFKPQRPVFNLPASACTMNAKAPCAYGQLVGLGRTLMGLYREWSPEKYQRQIELMANIRDCWKLPGTFFTQGIVNDTVNLDYHYDRGNIKGCWSCMAVFAREVEGGHLVIPALDLALAIEDETYVLFDGQSLLHGVSPIFYKGAHARRFSIVYYAIAAMASCGSYEEELQKMRQVDLRKHRKAKVK